MNNLISFGLHIGWRLKSLELSEQLAQRGSLRALDLCCGTGDYCLLLADKLGWGGVLTAIDFCPKMIELAERRLANLPNRHQIKLYLDDATTLSSCADNSFNLCTIGFGLRNVNDIPKCLNTIYRVLEPGGELIILDLSKPVHFLLLPFYLVFMHLIIPLLALILNGHLREYRWLIESLKYYPSYTELEKLLSLTGFSNLKTLRWLGGVIAVHYGVKK